MLVTVVRTKVVTFKHVDPLLELDDVPIKTRLLLLDKITVFFTQLNGSDLDNGLCQAFAVRTAIHYTFRQGLRYTQDVHVTPKIVVPCDAPIPPCKMTLPCLKRILATYCIKLLIVREALRP